MMTAEGALRIAERKRKALINNDNKIDSPTEITRTVSELKNKKRISGGRDSISSTTTSTNNSNGNGVKLFKPRRPKTRRNKKAKCRLFRS